MDWRQYQFQNQQDRTAFCLLNMVSGIGRSTLLSLINARMKGKSVFGLFLGKRMPSYAYLYLSEKQIDSIQIFKNEHKSFSVKSFCQKYSLHLITIFDNDYPKWLKQTDDPPLVLYLRGNSKLLKRQRWVAIVGTRRMTTYGKQATYLLVNNFVSYGWGIVSGGMYGVDAAAHQACIGASGATMAVLGYGFQAMPPSAQRLLLKIVASDGLLISEFPPWITAKPGHFPLRNRIVAGLSQAVVVVEAARKSGSHITARCGLDAGKVVAAVPGPITSPYSQGTTWLLNQGAVCVGSAADVLSELRQFPEEISQFTKHKKPQFPFGPKSLERKIYDMLLTQPCSTQLLASQLAVPVAQLVSVLSTLEISGYLERTDTMWSIAL